MIERRDLPPNLKARYFGAEYACNPGRENRREYLDSCAMVYGFDDWEAVPQDVRREIMKEFNYGKQVEEGEQGRVR